MDLQLRGVRVLVTGSSSGIGAGIARVLAAEGAVVAVHGRDATRAAAVAAEVRSAGGNAVVVLGDLASEEGTSSVADAVDAALGGIDVLVNNAGGKTSPGNPAWFEIPWTDWVGTYEQNIGAAVRLIHRFVPGMCERGWGRVIQIGSASATQPEAGLGEYQAAKAARHWWQARCRVT